MPIPAIIIILVKLLSTMNICKDEIEQLIYPDDTLLPGYPETLSSTYAKTMQDTRYLFRFNHLITFKSA